MKQAFKAIKIKQQLNLGRLQIQKYKTTLDNDKSEETLIFFKQPDTY